MLDNTLTDVEPTVEAYERGKEEAYSVIAPILEELIVECEKIVSWNPHAADANALKLCAKNAAEKLEQGKARLSDYDG